MSKGVYHREWMALLILLTGTGLVYGGLRSWEGCSGNCPLAGGKGSDELAEVSDPEHPDLDETTQAQRAPASLPVRNEQDVRDHAARVESRYRGFRDSDALSLWIASYPSWEGSPFQEQFGRLLETIQKNPEDFLSEVDRALGSIPKDAEQEKDALVFLLNTLPPQGKHGSAARALLKKLQ